MSTCLIPLDGSELATRILAPLHVLLKVQQLQPLLFSVVPNCPPAEQEACKDLAQAHLDEVKAGLKAEGLTVKTRLDVGDPADRIVALAEAEDVALIALATHGHSGVKRLMRGSVAERVVRHAYAPILLSNPHTVVAPEESFKKILVPLDGSDTSAQILDQVIPLAQAYGSKVTLLVVEPFLYSALPSPMLNPQSWDAERTRKTVYPGRDRLEEAGVEVEVQAAYGVEAAEILQAAHGMDLVAMTTHGRSGPSRWLFGSVAESVIRHCDQPLLVVRQRT